MSLFPHTVTIFNKYEVDNKVEYERCVITGVQFVLDAVNARKLTGDSRDDKVACYIPKTAKVDKTYIEPFTYKYSENIDRCSSYTIAKEDLIALGDVSLDDLSVNEYRNKFGGLYEITAVTSYDFGSTLDHHLITAK